MKVKEFLTGMGSLLDLRGETTYRRVEMMLPPPTQPKQPGEIFLNASAQTRNVLTPRRSNRL